MINLGKISINHIIVIIISANWCSLYWRWWWWSELDIRKNKTRLQCLGVACVYIHGCMDELTIQIGFLKIWKTCNFHWSNNKFLMSIKC